MCQRTPFHTFVALVLSIVFVSSTLAQGVTGTVKGQDEITVIAAIYSFNWGDYAEVELRAEVFNLLDTDGTTEVYEYAEVRPDEYKLPTTYQQPRYLRIGAAIRF